ncbi:hypothetical protein ACWEVD_18370 [Nocardia thailandica]|uniref:ESX-1 secretion-associated protein n=1 Tax=Nocardia thailandica TaxID=257275 RepID=A0ABW6PKM1_9NOCA|nr:hypothetical protein [Nocardia thailandica]
MPPNPTSAPDTAALQQAVDEGELWIDGVLVAEGAHERCALGYERLAQTVEDQIALLGGASALPGFGGLESGAQLRAGFETKTATAIATLTEYARTARELAATFRAAAAAYRASDDTTAAGVAGIEIPEGPR